MTDNRYDCFLLREVTILVSTLQFILVLSESALQCHETAAATVPSYLANELEYTAGFDTQRRLR